MGAPKGNQNATKEHRLFGDAIRRAVVQGDGHKLRAIADKLVEMAVDGDIQAIREIADRLDGKAPQAITGADGKQFILQITSTDAQV